LAWNGSYGTPSSGTEGKAKERFVKAVKAAHDKQRRDCAGQRKDYQKKNGGMKN
jgi:hypothetical protein